MTAARMRIDFENAADSDASHLDLVKQFQAIAASDDPLDPQHLLWARPRGTRMPLPAANGPAGDTIAGSTAPTCYWASPPIF